MLHGTIEEFEYHSERALQEFDLSQRCNDETVKNVHLELAELHKGRSELVAALRSARTGRPKTPIFRTDKEG